MKSNSDLAQEWLKKAESDFANAELCISNSIALDTACFHCQQAAEKSLKAWLIAHDTPFPKEHKLEKPTAAWESWLPATNPGYISDARLVRDRTEFFDECRAFLSIADHERVVFS